MKRTISFLVLAIASAGLAQTPAATDKPKAPSSGAKVAVSSVKPAPGKASVKPVAVSVAAPGKAGASPTVQPAAKPAAQAAAKSSTAPHAVAAVKPAAKGMKPAAAPVQVKTVAAGKAVAGKIKPEMKAATVKVAASGPKVKSSGEPQDGKDQNADKKPAKKVLNAVARRDPFTSPVVSMGPTGSGCSTGKRCLAIDQIALRGVVKSDSGMIAVVVNAMDKAYFLRENDPVFNGYVVKITGDSIIFKETFHDRLGKALTRDVTKSISRPAA